MIKVIIIALLKINANKLHEHCILPQALSKKKVSTILGFLIPNKLKFNIILQLL